jgi:hypothetical protein
VVAPGIEPGTSGSVVRTTEAVFIVTAPFNSKLKNNKIEYRKGTRL